MPSKLQTRPAQKLRNLLYNNFAPSNVANYDPSIADPSNANFLPITTNWNSFGDTYPIITLTNFSGNILGGGDTSYTGMQGNGSGLNQDRNEIGLLTIQAEELDTGDYNGPDAQDILHILSNECERIIQANASAQNDNNVWWFSVEPPDRTVDNSEATPLFQHQHAVGFGWHDEP